MRHENVNKGGSVLKQQKQDESGVLHRDNHLSANAAVCMGRLEYYWLSIQGKMESVYVSCFGHISPFLSVDHDDVPFVNVPRAQHAGAPFNNNMPAIHTCNTIQ